MASSCKRTALWSDIPSEILTVILKKVSIIDVLNCKSVCVSWRPIANAHALYLSAKLEHPLLIVPDKTLLSFVTGEGKQKRWYDEEDYNFLYCFSSKKFLKFDKVLGGRSCIGSSQGWLIFFDDEKSLYTFNPFLDVGFNLLPSIDPVSMKGSISKAIMWGDPIRNNNNYGIVIIFGCGGLRQKLIFASCRENGFADLEASQNIYYDVTCYKNCVYGLSSSGSVEAWDWNGSNPVKVLDIKSSFPEEKVEDSEDRYFLSSTRDLYSRHYYVVVDSMGEILLVKRYVAEHLDSFANGCVEWVGKRSKNFPYLTMLFIVYKLDQSGEKWVEVDSLGEQILFVGGNDSVALPSKDLPEYTEDSIYFTDNYWGSLDYGAEVGGHDMGVFSMADSSLERFCGPEKIEGISRAPFWVVRAS